MILGLCILAISTLGFGFLNFIEDKTIFIICSLITRMLTGLSCAFYATPVYAVIPQIYPKDIEKYIGLLEMGAGISFLIGPLYGGLFFYIGGYTWTFVSMVFIIITVIPFFLYFRGKIEKLISENRENLLSNCGE